MPVPPILVTQLLVVFSQTFLVLAILDPCAPLIAVFLQLVANMLQLLAMITMPAPMTPVHPLLVANTLLFLIAPSASTQQLTSTRIVHLR
jgi:hypothetical protein